MARTAKVVGNGRVNPLGEGRWEEFQSHEAAKRYGRLMEGEGKAVVVHGNFVNVREKGGQGGKRNPIQDPNSSGQGYDSDHTGNPYSSILSKHGYTYSHSTPINYRDGRRILHTYKKGDYNVSVNQDVHGSWQWSGGKGGSRGGGRSGRLGVDLDKYLNGVEKRTKSNPEGSAADMYESFHGAPSEQLVTFHDEEHYHEYLAELGVCCGVLVEVGDGSVQAIGLSGYKWEGKGKDAGFVEGTQTRSNPNHNTKLPVYVVKNWQVPYMRGVFASHGYVSLMTARRAAARTNAQFIIQVTESEGKHVAYAIPHDSVSPEVLERNIRAAETARRSENGKKGPFTQASDLVMGGVKDLDSQLGKVLKGNPASFIVAYPQSAAQKTFSGEKSALNFAKKLAKEEYKTVSVMVTTEDVFPKTYAFVHPDGRIEKRNPSDAIDPITTLLCSNEDGTQLYLQGGDQSLDLDALGITGHLATKELITIGDVVKLHYETAKDFDKFEEIQYHHELGEESGELPVLAYDRLNERLLFVGGAYRIEKPLFETSPGIED